MAQRRRAQWCSVAALWLHRNELLHRIVWRIAGIWGAVAIVLVPCFGFASGTPEIGHHGVDPEERQAYPSRADRLRENLSVPHCGRLDIETRLIIL